jgi:serine phosphatase RsbU (regulator of sigma subunit)
VTEAQDQQGTFFGKEQLLEILRSGRSWPAGKMQSAVLAAVHEFSAGASHAHQDDITLVVVVRDLSEQ